MEAPARKLGTAAIAWAPPRAEDVDDEEYGLGSSKSIKITPTSSETSSKSGKHVRDDLDDATNTKISSSSISNVAQTGSNIEAPDQQHAATATSVADSPPRPLALHTQLSGSDLAPVTPNLLDELRSIIKQEIAIAGHAKTNEAISPALETQMARITPASVISSMLPHHAYPSPPPSIAAASTSSRISTPPSASPKAANTVPASSALGIVTTTSTSPQAAPLSPVAPPTPSERSVRFRDRRPPVIHSQGRSETFPASPVKMIAAPDSSTAEQGWGILFDHEGKATHRLGHVLRSLANQVIAQFGALGGVVVSPDKMGTLYSQYKASSDDFHYEDIFKHADTSSSFERIGELYRRLSCQYHLAQASPAAPPTVPGLTPIGFASWFTTAILAYPDQECRRINALLADLPPLTATSEVTGRPGYLPKNLPRTLFPAKRNDGVRRRFDDAILDCLENQDFTSPLPSASHRPRASRHSSFSDGRSPSATTTPGNYMTRPSHFEDERRLSMPVNPRSANYGNGNDPGRSSRYLARTNSDTTSIAPRHGLRPPPIGRHRPPSPPPDNRYTASVPNVRSLDQPGSPSEFMHQSPTSPHMPRLPRSSGTGPPGDDRDRDPYHHDRMDPGDHASKRRSFADFGPTWDDFYRKKESRVRDPSPEYSSGGHQGPR